MLSGLQILLRAIPKKERTGWIVSPAPKEYQIAGHPEWYQPSKEDLTKLVASFSNCAIAEACCVSETTVRKWMASFKIQRTENLIRTGERLSANAITKLRKTAKEHKVTHVKRNKTRLTEAHVGRVISEIGEAARVIVQQADDYSGKRLKFASAHDLRRGCAERLINAGVSAETLKVIFRHSSFSTTEKHYGASRSAQSAAKEVASKLTDTENTALVGGIEKAPQLNAEELLKLKSLLNSL